MIELATGTRSPSAFPPRWIVRGSPIGEGRAALAGWIAANIAEDRALGIRSPSADTARRRAWLELMRRRDPPR